MPDPYYVTLIPGFVVPSACCQYEDDHREENKTFIGYLTSSITLITAVFLIFILIEIVALILTSYARNDASKEKTQEAATVRPTICFGRR